MILLLIRHWHPEALVEARASAQLPQRFVKTFQLPYKHRMAAPETRSKSIRTNVLVCSLRVVVCPYCGLTQKEIEKKSPGSRGRTVVQFYKRQICHRCQVFGRACAPVSKFKFAVSGYKSIERVAYKCKAHRSCGLRPCLHGCNDLVIVALEKPDVLPLAHAVHASMYMRPTKVSGWTFPHAGVGRKFLKLLLCPGNRIEGYLRGGIQLVEVQMVVISRPDAGQVRPIGTFGMVLVALVSDRGLCDQEPHPSKRDVRYMYGSPLRPHSPWTPQGHCGWRKRHRGRQFRRGDGTVTTHSLQGGESTNHQSFSPVSRRTFYFESSCLVGIPVQEVLSR
eukprot:m.195088 g.195088  ORF g.195088 m.195088 type:complete len:336 (-) comp19381_c0_seq1:148-1155(-)